jgi:hypothetical protein
VERRQVRDDAEAAFRFETRVVADWLEEDSRLRERHHGANLDGYQQAVDEWWSRTPSKYAQGLTPEAQRLAARSLAAKRLQALSGAGAYFNAEKERATVAAAESKKQTAMQAALVDGRPEAIATARREIRETNAFEAARRGMTPEELAAANLRDLTTLHGNAIVALLDRDTKAAAAYFAANADEIDASKHGGIKQAIERSGLLERVQAKADEIMGLSLPLDQAVARAREQNSGEDEKQLVAELQHRYSIEEAAKNKRVSELFGAAQLELVTTGKVSRSTLAALPPAQQAQLIAAQRAAAKAAAAGGNDDNVKTDINVYQQVREAIAAGEHVALGAYADKISRGDLKQLADYQTNLKNPTAAKRLFTEERMIDNYALQMKLSKGTDRWNAWRYAAEEAITRLHEEKGNQMTDADVRDRLDRLVTEVVVVGGGWFGTNATRRLFEVAPSDLQRTIGQTPEAKRAIEVQRIPAEERAKIVDALRRRGAPINDTNVLMLWAHKQQATAR